MLDPQVKGKISPLGRGLPRRPNTKAQRNICDISLISLYLELWPCKTYSSASEYSEQRDFQFEPLSQRGGADLESSEAYLLTSYSRIFLSRVNSVFEPAAHVAAQKYSVLNAIF